MLGRGGGGGGDLIQTIPRCMCVSKSEGHGSFFRLQGSEMSENHFNQNECRICFITQYWQEFILSVVHHYTYKNGDNELQST